MMTKSSNFFNKRSLERSKIHLMIVQQCISPRRRPDKNVIKKTCLQTDYYHDIWLYLLA